MAATSALQLREQLRHSQFWLLEAIFAALVAFTALNLPECLRTIRGRRGEYAAVLLLSLLAAGLAAGVAPRTNRIYYDEQIYQGVARNLSDLHRAQMCNDGDVEYGRLQCWRGEYSKEPSGYPYLLSLVYRAAGVTGLMCSGCVSMRRRAIPGTPAQFAGGRIFEPNVPDIVRGRPG